MQKLIHQHAIDAISAELITIARARSTEYGLPPDALEHTVTMSFVRALATVVCDSNAKCNPGLVTPEMVADFIRSAPWESSVRVVLDRREGAVDARGS